MASRKPSTQASSVRTVANFVVSQLNWAIAMAGSFVVTPAVLDALGDASYGGWLLLNSFTNYLRLLDLGTTVGTIKFGSGAYERGDTKDLARVMGTSGVVFLVAGGAAAVGTVVLAVVLPNAYPVAADQGTTIFLLGGAMTLDLLFRPFASALQLHSRHFINDSIEIVTFSTFKLGLVLWYAHQHTLSYRVLAILTLAETGVRAVLVLFASLMTAPAARQVNPFRAELAMAKKLATMGAAIIVIFVADVVRFQLDSAVIGYFMPESPENISVFGVGTRLVSIAYSMIGVAFGVLMPRFSGLIETGERDGMRTLLRQSLLANGLIASLVLGGIGILGPHFLALWLHKPWIGTSGAILLMMVPAYYVALLSAPCNTLLLGGGHLRGLTILTVLEAAANFVLSILLVHSLGIYGVAIGTIIPMVIARGFFYPWLLKREIDVNPRDLLTMELPGIRVGVLFLLLAGGFAFVPFDSYLTFVACGVACVVLYGVAVVIGVPEVRRAIVQRLSRRFAQS